MKERTNRILEWVVAPAALLLTACAFAFLGNKATAQSLDSKLDRAEVSRTIVHEGYLPTHIIVECFSDDVTELQEQYIRGIQAVAEPYHFPDTVYQGNDTIVEDVRFYEYETRTNLYTLFIADAEGWLQQVLLIREPKPQQGWFG